MSRARIVLAVLCFSCALGTAGAQPALTPLAAVPAVLGVAGPNLIEPRDLLVYPNGDRLQGRLVNRTEKLIVFQSNRFGELRVPADEAVVILPDQVAVPVPVTPAATAAPERFTPAMLAARLGAFFGAWHGRFAFMTELVTDTKERSNFAVEMQLLRKWQSNEVQLKTRYDFSSTDSKTTTDVARADGLWRHDFAKGRFALYRPSLEWNRASYKNSVPNDYVQLQQEVGVGFSPLYNVSHKLRVGVSENFFYTWDTTPGGTQTARTVESVFLEADFKLPWRMNLLERGAYYLPFSSGEDGWENRIELAKRFTETLSTSLRHEIRRYNPDGKTQDFTRLRLLLGLDF